MPPSPGARPASMNPARLAGVLLALALAAHAAAQPAAAPARPAAAGRIVRFFDFEEQDSNPFPIPRYWIRAQEDPAVPRIRPGFPIWNEPVLDYTVAYQGAGSVRVPTKGGSASLCLDPGVIPVFPDADYVVAAKVRTDGLVHARAAIIARFLDSANQPIAASEARTEPVLTNGEWRMLSLTLPGDHPDAAFLQIELVVLQPRQFAAPSLPAQHQVWPEDLSGAAWFDDLSVAQLPAVRLSTNSPTNVIAAPDRPAVNVSTRDLTGESLVARLILQDLDGRIVDRTDRPLQSAQTAWTWTPRVDRLGWYRVTLELLSGGTRVGASFLDLAWVPEAHEAFTLDQDTDDRARFGLVLDEPPPGRAALIPELVARSGAGAVTLPAWVAALTPDNPEILEHTIYPLADTILAQGRRITLAFTRLPDALAAQTGTMPDRPLVAFTRDESLWAPYLLPLLDKYGQTVQRWQLGEIDPRAGLLSYDAVARVRSVIATLVPGPLVFLPSRAEIVAEHAGLAHALLVVPSAFAPDALPILAQTFAPASSADRAEASLVFDVLPEESFSRRDIASDLIKRAVLFWAAFNDPQAPAASAAILQPWTWSDDRRPHPLPTVALPVWRTLADRLTGRRIIGELPAGSGMRCYILAPAPGVSASRTGALVAWRETAAPEDAFLEAALGDGPIAVVDLFGNRTPLDPASAVSGGSHYRVPIGHTPVFIEGVDVAMASFVASFHLEPGFAPSDGSSHRHEIVLDNPWPMRIDGHITIVEPGGIDPEAMIRDRSWKITPRSLPFSIDPGGTARLPISIAFSAVEEAGLKDFVAHMDLIADRDYRGLRLSTPLEVGHEALQLDLFYRYADGPAGREIIIEAQATNKAPHPVTLEVTCFAPGAARRKASISDLAPGATAVRRFPFPNAERFRGQRITIGIEDIDSTARLTRSVLVE